MADQRHVLDVLQAHDARQFVAVEKPRKRDTGRQFGDQLFARHVGLVPAIRRDDPAIGRGPVVDHLVDRRNVGRPAIADHEAVSLAPAWANGPVWQPGVLRSAC
jgi:hypothetical protein